MKSHCYWFGLGMLLAAAPLLLAAGCEEAQQGMAPPGEVRVQVAVPIKKQIVEWDEYVGRLQPVEFVELRSRVSGHLQAIHFEEGQLVKEGDLLCVIDPRPFEAEVRRTEAALEEARAVAKEAETQLLQAQSEQKQSEARANLERSRMTRSRQLVASNTITREEFDVRESELLQANADLDVARSKIESAQAAIAAAAAGIETAQAAVEIAKLNLDYTQIRSPISGRVSDRAVTEGNYITGGATGATLLTTIVSLDPIHVYFDADELSFLKYSRLAREGIRGSSRDVKNPVYVGLADESPNFPHWGHMDFVDNRIDRETGTMRGRAILRNKDLVLTPGLFARLRLPGSASYEAILIPDSAVSSDQAVKFVYVVADDGEIRRQVIETGPISHGLRIVRKGLDGTEKIIVQGVQRVRPGVKAAPELVQIELDAGNGLPSEYTPVPKEDWISMSPARRPTREQIAAPTPTVRVRPASASSANVINGSHWAPVR